MKKKTSIALLVVSSILLFATITLVIVFRIGFRETESSTVLYSGTVLKVNGKDQDKREGESRMEIITSEYESDLLIPMSIIKNTNIDPIRNLQSGDKIFFRVKSGISSDVNSIFVDIVSLRTEKGEIFTLEEYNTYEQIETLPNKIFLAVFVLGMAALAVSSIVSIVKSSRKSKEKEI